MFVLGAIQILVYFVVFSFLIKKFNFHTPGREETQPSEDTGSLKEKAVVPKMDAPKAADASGALEGGGTAMDIIEGLGGKDNIVTVENCITRLRVTLKDPDLLQEKLINKTQNRGIVKKQNDIQIIYGLQVPDVRRAVEEQLAKL